jgi:hypothetical protein
MREIRRGREEVIQREGGREGEREGGTDGRTEGKSERETNKTNRYRTCKEGR